MTQSISGNSASARVNVVVPVYNKRTLLDAAITSIIAAAETHGATDISLVDNGSTDGSFELLNSRFRDKASVLKLTPGTIGAVRNFGARLGAADIVSFLDCDCLVPRNFFTVLEEVFDRTGAAAAGRRIVLPPNPTWVESTWDQMHQDGLDGERTWINSANLAVRRQVFEAVGGFDETLETGEDAELCLRIRNAGGRIMQDQRLAVAHLDNSKTLPAFYRKERWRGLGMFGTVSTSALDKPTAITLLHLLLCMAAAVIAFAPFRWEWRALSALTLILFAPAVTVAYRKRSSIHRFNVLHATVLYELYFLARINAILVLIGRHVRGVVARRPNN
jgi:GT2 family glycosyltransferase